MAVRAPSWRMVGGQSDTGGGSNKPIEEVPAGPLNGTNRVFTLSHTPAAGYPILLFLNGVYQNRFKREYTVSGNVVTYAVAPASSLSDENHAIVYWIGLGAPVGRARSFAGGTDSLDYGHNDLYSITGNLSIVIWLKLSSTSTGSIIGYAFNSASLDTPYYLQLAGSSGAWSIRYIHDYGGGSSVEDHTFTTNIPNDTWVCIALRRDTTAKTVECYVGDGETLSLFGTFSYTNNPGGSSASSRLMVGSISGGGGGVVTAVTLVGVAEEHYVYSAYLTVDELTDAMKGNPTYAGMVLGCDMGNSPEIDFSGNHGSGIVTGTTLVQGH